MGNKEPLKDFTFTMHFENKPEEYSEWNRFYFTHEDRDIYYQFKFLGRVWQFTYPYIRIKLPRIKIVK